MSVQASSDPAAAALSGLELTGWRLAALHLLIVGAVLSPLLWASYPPLVDYPNHLARIHVLANLDQDPTLQRFYQANWALLPNVAMDALLVPLARLVPIYLLGKLFVVGVLLLFVAATYALRWVLWGRIGLWPAAVLLVVYNYALAWGFLNYLFGAGLALLCLAGWIWARQRAPWSRSWTWLLPASTLAALLLFFSHLFALGVYALAVGGFELGRSLRRREVPFRLHLRAWLLGALQFALPVALAMGSTTVSDSALTYFGELKTRLTVPLSTATFHNHGVDLGILCFLLALLLGGIRLRLLTLHPKMKLPLLLLLIAAAIMPVWLFGSWAAHYRLAPVLAAIAIAASDLKLRRDFFSVLLPVLGSALLLMRIFDTTAIVQRNDAMMDELRGALAEAVPEGSALLVAIDMEGTDTRTFDWDWLSVLHLGSYAVIDRAVFLPTLFTDPRKQPLVVNPVYRHIDTPFAPPVSVTGLRLGTEGRWAYYRQGKKDWRGMAYYWAYWPRHYDRVLVIETKDSVNPVPDRLTPRRAGSYFTIYEVIDPQKR